MRIGYALASADVADLMNRVRQPFNCNNLALAAATAALDDHEFVARSYALNRAGMDQILAGLKRLGLLLDIPSYGNFLAFKAGDAATVNQGLLKQGVIVRPVAGYGMPEWLRVTIGTEQENQRFLEALENTLLAGEVMGSERYGSPEFGKVVVFGVGLIGGSFALGLKRRPSRPRRSLASGEVCPR